MKSKISNLVLICVVTIGLSFPGSTLAAQQGSLFNSFFKSIQDSISSFQLKMESLRNRIEEDSKVSDPLFTEYLYEGAEGEEVRRLQEFLSQFPEIYPEGEVTGYFDNSTKNAVMRFQREYDIPTVGYVGPETRSKLNELVLRQAEDKSTSTESNSGVLASDPEVDLNRGVSEDETSSQFIEPYSIEPQPDYNENVIERSIQDKVSEIRVSEGLNPIEWSDEVAEIAEEHSEEQAEDSRELVDSDKPCAFPILRHAGFESGLTVGDRLQNGGVEYKKTGENLVLFPVSTDMIYEYRESEGRPGSCPTVNAIDFSQADSVREKNELLSDEVLKRKQYLEDVEEVEWVNKDWKNINEISQQAVDMWMESEGHRNNLLHTDFTKGGVGVEFAGDYIIITHVLLQD